MDRDYDGKCATFCASLDPPRVCAGQWDDDDGTCAVSSSSSCSEQFDTNGGLFGGLFGGRGNKEAICQCSSDPLPANITVPSDWNFTEICPTSCNSTPPDCQSLPLHPLVPADTFCSNICSQGRCCKHVPWTTRGWKQTTISQVGGAMKTIRSP